LKKYRDQRDLNGKDVANLENELEGTKAKKSIDSGIKISIPKSRKHSEHVSPL